jgi:RND family efflux transporter MFP subunit
VQAQTTLDKSNEDLSYAQLLATFDGVVTATSVEVGQVVSAGESVLTVAMPGERDAVIDIPEGELIPAIGDAYSILLQINPSITSAGVVREVAPTADAATRTRRVKIALQNPPDAFRIGTTITAIRQARDIKKLFVPASAVLNQDGKTLVWIVDEKAETVRSQEVKLRDKTSAHPEVVSGLEPGTRVVIAGVHSLKEGQKIKVEGGARS